MPEVDPVYSVEDFFDSIAKYLSPEQVAFVRQGPMNWQRKHI